MSQGRLEILVEPFKEDDPGPHVMAVFEILAQTDFVVDLGPFSTTAEGPIGELISIVQLLTQAGFDAGATSIQARLERL
ncbi:MAG: hypothetical protein ACI88C_002437 [Acidimicrobiales bacterium]|jgi:uncharacterized protein YqgV (UPF0045/DUF77 family)